VEWLSDCALADAATAAVDFTPYEHLNRRCAAIIRAKTLVEKDQTESQLRASHLGSSSNKHFAVHRSGFGGHPLGGRRSRAPDLWDWSVINYQVVSSLWWLETDAALVLGVRCASF
jgi:hypothetical protein